MRKYHDDDFPRTPAQVRTNELLLTWRLAPGDPVVIAGGFNGIVSDLLLERYPAIEVYLFEPQIAMATALAERYADESNVHVAAYGLGAVDGRLPMAAAGSDAASFMVDPAARATAHGELREWTAVMADLDLDRIALLHLNIEGYEYLLLPHLLRTGWTARIDQMVVSTHPLPFPIPGAEAWAEITPRIEATHRSLWESAGWYGYERNA